MFYFARLPLKALSMRKGCCAGSARLTLVPSTALFSVRKLVSAEDNSQEIFVVKSKNSKSWIQEVIESLKIFLRSIQMAILLSPLVISAPLAIYVHSYKEIWLKLLVKTIQACGPVYVKLGQWASTRRDLFHPDLCNHLAKLQRQADVHSWHHTENTLKNEDLFGKLEEFHQLPIGSGCCAQVYKAKYQGEEVAVKVLHPNIKDRFNRDLTVMRSMINFVAWIFPQIQWLSVKESLEEFADLMNVQVDLRNEAKSLLKFHDNFRNEDNVSFPRPILQLCSEQVLVESFEHGTHIGTLLERLESMTTERRKDLASKGVDMFLKMVFRHNYVHCDLHPGNILVTDQDNLVILDPGLTASLAPKDKRNFRAVFSAVVKGDGRTVGEEILQQSLQECANPQQFINEIEEVVINARSKLSLAKVDVADLLTRVFNVFRSHRVKLDPNFTSVIISIMVLEGLGRTLDPELDLLWAAAPFLIY